MFQNGTYAKRSRFRRSVRQEVAIPLFVELFKIQPESRGRAQLLQQAWFWLAGELQRSAHFKNYPLALLSSFFPIFSTNFLDIGFCISDYKRR
jgi:hypothetical protein